jgi:hypothetical protein
MACDHIAIIVEDDTTQQQQTISPARDDIVDGERERERETVVKV